MISNQEKRNWPITGICTGITLILFIVIYGIATRIELTLENIATILLAPLILAIAFGLVAINGRKSTATAILDAFGTLIPKI